MVSRSVRLPEKAIDVARMCYRHTERIAKHPDAKDLNFRCSAALLELDLIEESIAKSQELIKPSKNVEVRARFGGSVTAQHRRCSFWHRLIGKKATQIMSTQRS